MATNLAPGSAYKGHKLLPTVIPSHTLPDIKTDTIIIGVCGVPLKEANPIDSDGWFISDFCAFNYLLKGLGSKQIWISAVSEQDLLHLIEQNPVLGPGFLHGNPSNDRKIVFNKDLVQREELTPFTVCKPSDIIAKVISEIKLACSLAKQTTPPKSIIVLLFGHGVHTLGICLEYADPEEKKKMEDCCLTITHLKSSISPEIPVTLVTTACHSGEWAISPDLNMTILTAAGDMLSEPTTTEQEEPKRYSYSWDNSTSIGRACGSVFASMLINTLTDSASPLLEGVPPEVTHKSLQPSKTTDIQTKTFNEFCWSIVRTLGENTTDEGHEFRFAAQDDDWTHCWLGRTGIPLSYFQQRWDNAPIYKATSNILCAATGSSYHGDAVADRISAQTLRPDEHSENFLRRAMQKKAAMLANSCPGDWHMSPNGLYRGFLRDYSTGETRNLDFEDFVIDIMLFRLQTAELVDTIVVNLKLSQPFGQACLQWDRQRWFRELHMKNKDGYKYWATILRCMRVEGLSGEKVLVKEMALIVVIII
ncbi:hypothetical protein F5884DRAFT_801040 [Xylogone sp. PMI_703]|nr:hypothetical protein F5884DRAFT_801040 [Xylogone sp. PMI_703]